MPKSKTKISSIEQADMIIQALQTRVVYLEDSLTAGTGPLWEEEVNRFCEIVLRDENGNKNA